MKNVGLNEALAQVGADIVHGGNHDGNRQHVDACGPVVEQVDVLLEHEADPTTADKTDDRGHTHVNVPSVHGKGNVRWNDLRDNCENDGLQAVGAGGSDRFQRAFQDALNLFGIELGQGGHGVQAKRQGTGEWSKPDPGDEHDRHHQGFNGAGAIQYCADDPIKNDPDWQRLLG